MDIKAVLFDFGGVYYTEGFREGLFAIAEQMEADRDGFFERAVDAVFSTGYVTGRAPESLFWKALASERGVDVDLYPKRDVILKAFQPDKKMIGLVKDVREVVPVALLTDQTNWLYELDSRDGFLSDFDDVISSYEEGYSKRDREIFRIACARLNIYPEEGIFFDDNPANVERAGDFGLRSTVFTDPVQARETLVLAGVLGKEGLGEGARS
jgi:putative hydrolase of the HAD superfamily